jgi:ABC-type uncharacterized transport system/Domain of unknown function (DUF4350)
MAMSSGLTARTPTWVAPAYVAGLMLVFLGERVLSTIGWLRLLLTGIGVLLIAVLTAVRWVAVRVSHGEARSVARALALLSTGGLLAVAMYFTTTDRVEERLGIATMALASRQRFESAMTVAWVALAIGTLVPMLFAERAIFPMRRSNWVEWRRVREALGAGLILSLVAVYGSLFTFVAGELALKADFSYFHTARPSESTRKLAESARSPVDILAFFPEVNPVGVEASAYLRDLARGLPPIRLQISDRLLQPDAARQAKVFEDGIIVVERGSDRETISLGTDIATARPKLKALDTDFQKALLKVLREKRTAYFTVGHGELNDTQPTPQNEGRTGRGLRQLLEQQNYTVRDLDAATGLLTDVPADASIVLVVGPGQPFLPEEAATLGRYAARGGRLLLCLDPEAKANLQPLADIVGLGLSSSVLANDKVHLRRRYNDSDATLLITNRYSSHASVSTLSRIASRPVVFVGAGSLERKPSADAALRVDFTVRALADTFNDENGNWRFDPPAEKRDSYALGAAVSKRADAASPTVHGEKKSDEMRAFVLGDADVLSDAALGNDANALLLADAIHWLGGEESLAGAMSTPEDIRIEHTKQKDLVWFYGSIFGAPSLVLGAGLLYTHRIRRSKKNGASQSKPSSEAVRRDGVAA